VGLIDVGDPVGVDVGLIDGVPVGNLVGERVGNAVGFAVGKCVGEADGCDVVGDSEGACVATFSILYITSAALVPIKGRVHGVVS
jgi:hypothetical protein